MPLYKEWKFNRRSCGHDVQCTRQIRSVFIDHCVDELMCCKNALLKKNEFQIISKRCRFKRH